MKISKAKVSELRQVVDTAQNQAVGNYTSNISNQRAQLERWYNAGPYGDEVEDRSEYVATDVRDTVESVKPELMDIFFGGDRVVQFDPRSQEDVDPADQETDVVNYIIQQENEGFKVFLDWFHDALVTKVGYVKRFWDRKEMSTVQEYDDCDRDEVEQIMQNVESDPDVTEWELLEFSGEEYIDEATGEPALFQIQDIETMEVKLVPASEAVEAGMPAIDVYKPPYRFKIREKKVTNKYRIVSVPPEEVYVHPEWTELHFDGCPFHAHRAVRTKSDLVAEGFMRSQVEDLPEYDIRTDNPERQERFENEFGYETQVDMNAAPSMVEVLIYENYVYFDADGDGIAELLKVYTDENAQILKWKGGKNAIEQVDKSPFNALCPIPIPHKHFGLALAELVEDLQRIRTWLTRQLLDNHAMHNTPDVVVDDKVLTPDLAADLSQTRTGRVIRAKGGAASVAYMPVPDLTSQSLSALGYVDSVRESRTGVTAYNQGMDADSLNKTAHGIDRIMRQSEKKILLIARIFAETGVKSLFRDIHSDLRSGPVKRLTIKLRNEWINVNPRIWRERTDMSVSVGLGTGDRTMQFQRLMMILQQQKEALMQDPTGQIFGVTPRHIHHTLSKMLELSGFKDVNNFFPEPKEGGIPQPEQGPDVAQIAIQAELQKEQIKAQTKMAELAQEQKEFMAKLQADTQQFMQQLQQDFQLKITEIGVNAELRREEIASREKIEGRKSRNAVAGEAARMAETRTQRDEDRVPVEAEGQAISALTDAIAAMNLPKRVIRDEGGNIIGAEPYQPEAPSDV